MTKINVGQGKAKSGQEVEEASEPATTEEVEEANSLATTEEVDETEVDEASEPATTEEVEEANKLAADASLVPPINIDISMAPDLEEAQKLAKIESLQLVNQQHKADNEERLKLTIWAKRVVLSMLLLSVAGIGFYLYASFYVMHVMPDSAVLVTWLSSTVVEVIGIMYVIVRYLFPQQETDGGARKSSPVKKDS